MDDLLRVLSTATAEDLAVWRRFVDRAGADAVASWLAPNALVACMLGDTRFAAAALETLRAPDSASAQQVTAAFPEAAALAHPAPPQVEHDPPTVDGTRGSRSAQPRPLLDHIATPRARHQARRAGSARPSQFQVATKPGLSQGAFDELAALAQRVLDAGLGPALRAAIIHLDIAKTAHAAQRAAWAAQGISLEVHNEAAAAILRPPNARGRGALPRRSRSSRSRGSRRTAWPASTRAAKDRS